MNDPKDASHIRISNTETYILFIGSETVVDASRQNNHIVLDKVDTNPLVLLSADVEVSLAIENVPNLFVLVKMLGEERLDLLFVDITHGGWRNTHLVAIPVSALRRNGIHSLDRRAMHIQHA